MDVASEFTYHGDMVDSFSGRFAWLAYVAGATTLFFLGLLGFEQWDTARWEQRVRAEIQASNERDKDVADYLSLLRDIETGQRGYLVTNDRAYLQPYVRARELIPGQEAKLRGEADPTSQNGDLVIELLSVGAARLDRAQEALKLAESDRQAARSLVAEGTGKRLMDRARTLAAQIERNELRLSSSILSQSSAERRDRLSKIYFTEAAALLSLTVLLLSLAGILGRLRQTTATLRDSATRQAAIFEGATDAMMMLDRGGVIENVNSAALKMFGRTREALIGESNLTLFKDPPPEEVSQAYLRRLAAGDAADNRQMFVGLKGDGSTIDAEVVTAPILLEDGLHFLAVARDATERRKVEKMKDEFVATVSHELRTPLTSVAGSLGLILGGAAGEISEKATRLVRIAHNNCNRLIRLINEMLDIEKVESGKAQLRLEPMQLDEAVHSAVAGVSSFADLHNVELKIDSHDPSSQVIADPDRFAQILTNLLSNAVKFSSAHGTVTVRTSDVERERIRIAVEDRGHGVDDAFKDRIFQKFAQADSTDSRQKGGTGLGLSIVKELAERMGGTVGFDSELGVGSVFWVELPTAPQLGVQDLPAMRLGRMDESGDAQVLHVDDDADTLRVVASALENTAIVHSSPSLEEARAALQRYEFDAIVLDLAMPNGSGAELVELVRPTKSGTPPIILYTALDDIPENIPPTFARLTKSKNSLDELVQTVRDAIAGEGEK